MEYNMHLVCSFLIFLILSLLGVQAQVLIGPTPATQAVLVGTNHRLSCRRGPDGATGSLTWEEDATPTVTIFLDENKQSLNTKYTNFNLDPDNLYDMVITNIAVEDEGTYLCRNFVYPDSATTITRTVEVPLTSFVLSQSDIPTSLVTVTEGVPSDIVCSAVGARPAVIILWYHTKDGGSETQITEGVTQENTDNGDTTDSVSTLTYTATKDYNGGSLRCETSGQVVAPVEEAEASLNVQYIPFVEVNYGGDKVTCTSDANPTVTIVKIFVNDTEGDSPTCEGTTCTLPLKVDYDTDIRCNATNTIGTGTATTVAVPGAPSPTTPTPTVKGTTKKSANPSTLNVGAIVGPLVAVLVGVAVVICAVIYVKKKKNDPSSKPTPTPKPRSSSNSNEMKPVNGSQNAASNNTAEEGKKKNAEGLLYAELDHNKPPTQPNSGQNDIIRTEEATQYADVKSFIKDST